MTTLQQARADSLLDRERRDTDGSVITIRAWLQRKVAGGSKPISVEVQDSAMVNKLERELAQLRRNWEPSGNPNWPATKRYYAVKQALADGPKKMEYRLVDVERDCWLTLTKTEYDYAMTL